MSKGLITLTDEIVRNNDIPTTDLDGEIGMLQIETGKYFSLEGVSSTIWQLTEKPVCVYELVNKLMLVYDVDESTCINQTLIFLESMLGNHLIHLVSANKLL